MDELIQMITKQLGLDASVARGAVDRVAGMIKSQTNPELFSQIAQHVPGFSQAAESPEPSSASDTEAESRGLFGSIANMAAKALGGSAGQSVELAGKLKDLGIPADKIAGLINMVVQFIRDKAGDQVVGQLLAKFPLLKQFLT